MIGINIICTCGDVDYESFCTFARVSDSVKELVNALDQLNQLKHDDFEHIYENDERLSYWTVVEGWAKYDECVEDIRKITYQVFNCEKINPMSILRQGDKNGCTNTEQYS